MWKNPKHHFISPLRSVGTVVSNGKVSQEMVTNAYTNRTPYWGLADGTYKDLVGVMKRGEIIYQYHSNTGMGIMSACSTDPVYIERENTTLKGLSILNGQGDSLMGLDGNHHFANTIQVLGIVEMSNDVNCNGRLNVISGGIHDVRNNGNETINVGDYVYAYAPSRDEMCRGGGKTPNIEEKNGVVKLWYKPYHPELHRYQLKQIYDCLRDVTNSKNYMPMFRRSCHQFIDSTSGMFIIYLAKLLPELRKVISGPVATRIESDPDLLAHMLAKAGHSEFKSHPASDPVLHMQIIDSLFVPFSTNSKNATEYLFPVEPENATKRERDLMKRLNSIQQKSPALYQETIAYFINQLRNLIIGQAKSTARPGDDFSLMLTLQ